MAINGFESDAFELKRMMRQDAHEKAFETQVLGQRIFEREKDKLVKIGIKAVKKEFQEKEETLEINQKILISTKTNENRLRRMVSRNDCLVSLRAEAKAKLASEFTSNSVSYQNTIKNLIIQVSTAKSDDKHPDYL